MMERILEVKRREVETLKGRRFGERTKPIISLRTEEPVNIIAELKRKSPSAGFINDIDDRRIEVYSRYACAISVLTDAEFFGGSMEFLTHVTDITLLPVLCKDFIIHPVQIDAAYAAGADLVLLIARILSVDELTHLYTHARDLGLECLVEVHEVEELAKIARIAPPIVGVNARDLDTLAINVARVPTILKSVSAKVKVAESGIKSRRDMEQLSGFANTFLIGETLMRSSDIDSTFQELLYG
jgi:indole-3-glycerol phosphate synthase